jgi:hypothetical protein
VSAHKQACLLHGHVVGGRPKGLPAQAEAAAMAAQTLYRGGRLSVSAIEPYGMKPLESGNYALSIPIATMKHWIRRSMIC